MLELIITFPKDKERNLGPLLGGAPDFFSDLIGIRWSEVPEAAPLPRVKAEAPKRTKFYHPDMTTPQCIMAHYTPSGTFTRKVASKWFRDAGFAESSINSAVGKLIEHGYVKPISVGKYQFLKEMDVSKKIALP